MNRGRRVSVFFAITTVVATAAAVYVAHDAGRYRGLHDVAPAVAVVAPDAAPDIMGGPRIVFRHTGVDDHYGLVAAVSLDDPGGARAFTDVACDRVDATAVDASCLRTQRGVVTKYQLLELAPDWSTTDTVGLPGIPNRTRLSPDGSLVATTTFTAGHSYMQVGFSTATEIREVGGRSLGNLEDFALTIDGRVVSPVDRNVWGVTFVDDSTFYATVATGGRTHLVRGDLDDRTLTAVRTNAECPSVSPDGRRVAYKVDSPADGTHWSIAVLDLATGAQTVLTQEKRNVDDQVEWLDDDTLLYGMPREDAPGVTDVWAIGTTPDATDPAASAPRVLVEQAWSPAVVRP